MKVISSGEARRREFFIQAAHCMAAATAAAPGFMFAANVARGDWFANDAEQRDGLKMLADFDPSTVPPEELQVDDPLAEYFAKREIREWIRYLVNCTYTTQQIAEKLHVLPEEIPPELLRPQSLVVR